jgi:hypothetical protein
MYVYKISASYFKCLEENHLFRIWCNAYNIFIAGLLAVERMTTLMHTNDDVASSAVFSQQ